MEIEKWCKEEFGYGQGQGQGCSGVARVSAARGAP